MSTTRLVVRIGGEEGEVRQFRGRAAWALANLINSGAIGCTPITHVGPRWSDYVFKLRKSGIAIATITEAHGGDFKGTHARYQLSVSVEIIERAEGRAA